MEKKATYSYAERPGKHYNAAYGTFYDAIKIDRSLMILLGGLYE